MDDRIVGLDEMLTDLEKEPGYEPQMMGDGEAEFTTELGILMGMDIGSLGFRLFIGEPKLSLREAKDGETARRFAMDGYGSNRSSSFRLVDRIALDVGGGVYRQPFVEVEMIDEAEGEPKGVSTSMGIVPPLIVTRSVLETSRASVKSSSSSLEESCRVSSRPASSG